jgi:Zn finger protein HypA/HybF involved in hydrogenase expression
MKYKKKQDIKNNIQNILEGKLKIKYMPSFRYHLINSKLIEYRCSECDILDFWNGKQITLELDHINGDKNNNLKENLRFLCPNCHSQTKNFRAKNISNPNSKIICDSDFIKALKDNKNINQALLSLELDNSGGNYKRARSLLDKIKL